MACSGMRCVRVMRGVRCGGSEGALCQRLGWRWGSVLQHFVYGHKWSQWVHLGCFYGACMHCGFHAAACTAFAKLHRRTLSNATSAGALRSLWSRQADPVSEVRGAESVALVRNGNRGRRFVHL